jgi:hypothetical protein
MSQQTPHERGERRWTFVSVALFVIGLLILIPSGLCTGLALLSMIGSVAGFTGLGLSPIGAANAFFGSLTIILMFGGVPMALGALLMYSGLKARRRD